MTYYFCRISCYNRIAGNITGDDAACSDDGIVADCYSRQDGSATAYPYIIAYSDRLSPFHTRIARFGLERMAGSIHTDVGTDKDIVAYAHLSLIEYCQIKIGEEILTYIYCNRSRSGKAG